jgi:hypothetical protein
MPSRVVVADFVATILRGEFLEALTKFYAEDMLEQVATLVRYRQTGTGTLTGV